LAETGAQGGDGKPSRARSVPQFSRRKRLRTQGASHPCTARRRRSRRFLLGQQSRRGLTRGEGEIGVQVYSRRPPHGFTNPKPLPPKSAPIANQRGRIQRFFIQEIFGSWSPLGPFKTYMEPGGKSISPRCLSCRSCYSHPSIRRHSEQMPIFRRGERGMAKAERRPDWIPARPGPQPVQARSLLSSRTTPMTWTRLSVLDRVQSIGSHGWPRG